MTQCPVPAQFILLDKLVAFGLLPKSVSLGFPTLQAGMREKPLFYRDFSNLQYAISRRPNKLIPTEKLNSLDSISLKVGKPNSSTRPKLPNTSTSNLTWFVKTTSLENARDDFSNRSFSNHRISFLASFIFQRGCGHYPLFSLIPTILITLKSPRLVPVPRGSSRLSPSRMFKRREREGVDL